MHKLYSLLLRLSIFFRLVDEHDGNISLTNVALILVLYKLYSTPATSLNDVGTVFIGLLAYSIKKYINAPLSSPTKD